MTPTKAPLTEETAKRLTELLEKLVAHHFFWIHGSTISMLWSNFLRGLAFGLGSVLGATTLVYVVISILSQMEFIPLIGEWALALIEQIETSRSGATGR